MAEHRYAWRGNDRQGQRLRGEMQANSPSDVAEWLRQQRIRPTQIQRQWTLPPWLRRTRRPRIQADELTQMTRQLATLLHAGRLIDSVGDKPRTAVTVWPEAESLPAPAADVSADLVVEGCRFRAWALVDGVVQGIVTRFDVLEHLMHR